MSVIAFVEEFNDFVDGKGHVIWILEWVIGSFDGDEFNHVVFGKFLGILNRDHFIFRAVQNQHGVGEVKILVVEGAEGFEVIEEGLVNLHLALKANLDFLALSEFGMVGLRDAAAHRLVHVDGRAAQGDRRNGLPTSMR